MGKEDVRLALEAIVADQDLASQVEGGDLSGLDVELTDEERQLVIDAAGDMPEVAGFAMDAFLKMGDVKGEAWVDKTTPILSYKLGSFPKFDAAVNYFKF